MRLLSLILVYAILATIITAFFATPSFVMASENRAGEFDCAYLCSELGVLLGEGSGVTDEYLAKDSTRVQAAYLTLRLVGKETEAENYPEDDNFDDVIGYTYIVYNI